MRAKLTVLSLVLVLVLAVSAQAGVLPAVRAGLCTPGASLKNTHKNGFGVELVKDLALARFRYPVAVGVRFSSFPGRTKTWVASGEVIHRVYSSATLLTLFSGLRIGDVSGPYLLPALNVSTGSVYDRQDYEQSSVQVGLELGVGTRFQPSFASVRMDIGARLALNNVVTGSIPEAFDIGLDLEKLVNTFGLFVGIQF
ncbi:MAG: hypothetical protein GXO73_08975 [Calditrichaeota bacterium]|nr:hypothetical protein [Calditrichota bacterium]